MNIKNQLNQDIKKLAKQISKFIKAYSYKSAFLNYETKDLKYNDYLNLTAIIFGYADYNQYNLDDNKKILSLESLLEGFEKFLKNINPKSKYTQEDISQIVSTFKIYITLTEKDIINYNKSIKLKINRRIEKYKDSDDFAYEVGEVKRLYDILKKTNFKDIILDHRSIIMFDTKPLNEFNYLFTEYYNYRNALLIKKYIKDVRFTDRLVENLYLLEIFLKEEIKIDYVPLEKLEFLADQFSHYHAGINDFWSRHAIIKFRRMIAEKTVGKTALVEGVFHVIDESGKKSNYMNIARNKDGLWSTFNIVLANNDKMNIHIYEDGLVVAHKDFNGESIYVDLYDSESKNLEWTIPIVERNNSRKERFRFFYPKYESDKFILKLVFEEYKTEIVLNQHGFLNENDEVELSFKKIMEFLYSDYLLKITKDQSKDKKDFLKYFDFYKENYIEE